MSIYNSFFGPRTPNPGPNGNGTGTLPSLQGTKVTLGSSGVGFHPNSYRGNTPQIEVPQRGPRNNKGALGMSPRSPRNAANAPAAGRRADTARVAAGPPTPSPPPRAHKPAAPNTTRFTATNSTSFDGTGTGSSYVRTGRTPPEVSLGRSGGPEPSATPYRSDRFTETMGHGGNCALCVDRHESDDEGLSRLSARREDLLPLTSSTAAQYRFKASHDRYSKIIDADVARHQEELKAEKEKKRAAILSYRDELQKQIDERQRERERRREEQIAQKEKANKDFMEFTHTTQQFRNDQREKHREYARECEKQNVENASRRKAMKENDEFIAAMLIEDAKEKDRIEEELRVKRRAERAQQAEEMKRSMNELHRTREERRLKRVEEERKVLAMLDMKAAEAEEERKTHIARHQRKMPDYAPSPRREEREVVPDLTKELEEERLQQRKDKAQAQLELKEGLDRQMQEKRNKQMEGTQAASEARRRAEEDAFRFRQEELDRKEADRKRAEKNLNELKEQMIDGVIRQFDLTAEEAAALSPSRGRSARHRCDCECHSPARHQNPLYSPERTFR